MTRKIVIFGPYPPPYGGVNTFMSQLVAVLEGTDCSFELKIAERNTAFPDRSMSPNAINLFGHFAAVPRGSTVVDSSILFLPYPRILQTAMFIAAKFLKGLRWIKVIHDGTLPNRYQEFSALQRLTLRLSLAAADEVVAVGAELAGWLDSIHARPAPVRIISSLLPMLTPAPGEPLDPAIEDQLAGFDGIVCSTGTFTSVYGFDDIAIAVERLRAETGRNLGLVLVDGGFARDERYHAVVLSRGEWIIALQGLPHPDMLKLFRRASVFVRAAASESYGLSRVEAILCDLPVVATPVGETRGMFLFEHENIDQLTAQIGAALGEPKFAEMRQLAKRFRAEAVSNRDAWMELLNLGPVAP